jgi:hypothetical protein
MMHVLLGQAQQMAQAEHVAAVGVTNCLPLAHHRHCTRVKGLGVLARNLGSLVCGEPGCPSKTLQGGQFIVGKNAVFDETPEERTI